MAKQSPTATTPDNAGVGGDLRPVNEVPQSIAEPQHDDHLHKDGIRESFPPLVPVK